MSYLINYLSNNETNYECYSWRPERFNGGFAIDIPTSDNIRSMYNFRAIDPTYTFFEVQKVSYMLKFR